MPRLVFSSLSKSPQVRAVGVCSRDRKKVSAAEHNQPEEGRLKINWQGWGGDRPFEGLWLMAE